MASKCDTLCYRSPQYYLLRLESLPTGPILIGGVNGNALISAKRNRDQVRLALIGGETAMKKLNRQFVTMQLSFAATGGARSPIVFNSFWSPLRCSGLNFTAFTLSNGVRISPDTLMDTLYIEVFNTTKMNRTADMLPLANLLATLNGKC